MRTILSQSGVLVLLCTLALVEGFRIIKDNAGTYGAELAGWYVIGLGAILALLTVLYIIENRSMLTARPAAAAVPAAGEAAADKSQRKVWLLLSMVAAYIIMIDYLGYTLSTVLFFTGFLKLLGGYRWGKALAYSLLFGVVSGYIFMQVGMALPTGIFG